MSSKNNKKSILLEDFQNPINQWSTLNDPVMGGQSYSNVEIENGVANFTGKCAIVPKLQAPGFITMETGSQFSERPARFPDISSCTSFQFELKTNTDYEGYRFSFGKAHVKGGRFAYGYKAPLSMDIMPPVGQFGSVVVAFDKFSDKWDDATGNIITECTDDPAFCPSKQWLQRMETMSFWGEGVSGNIDLEIKTIHAIGCDVNASEHPVAPSLMVSKMHTVTSNPFFLAVAVMVAVLACMVVACCCCGCVCLRRRRYKNIPASNLGTYKDDPTSQQVERFHDEPHVKTDIELC